MKKYPEWNRVLAHVTYAVAFVILAYHPDFWFAMTMAGVGGIWVFTTITLIGTSKKPKYTYIFPGGSFQTNDLQDFRCHLSQHKPPLVSVVDDLVNTEHPADHITIGSE